MESDRPTEAIVNDALTLDEVRDVRGALERMAARISELDDGLTRLRAGWFARFRPFK